jgi:hypothetical protein
LTTSFTVWNHILSTGGDASVAQFLTLHIYFSHPSLVVYFVAPCNPTPQTEIGTAQWWGTTNSKPPGPIMMIGQSKTLTSSEITFTTLSSAGAHG